MRVEFVVASDGLRWILRRGATARLSFDGQEQALVAARNLAQAATAQGERALVKVVVGGELQAELMFEPEQMRPFGEAAAVRRPGRHDPRWPGVVFGRP